MGLRIPLFLFVVLVSSSLYAEKRIAVLDLNDSAGLTAFELDALTDDVRGAALVLSPAYIVMNRESMMALVPPGTDLRSVCSESSCETEAGAMLGADLLVTGSVGRFAGDLEVRLKLFDTAKSSFLGQVKANGSDLKVVRPILDEQAKRLFESVRGVAPLVGAAAPSAQIASTGVEGFPDEGKGPHAVGAISQETGFLILTSEPTGATLFLNGKEIGTAPKQIEQTVGHYEVTAALGRLYHPSKQYIELTKAGADVNLTLAPAFGRLDVTSEPPGAEVSLDGEKVGTTPWAAERKPSGTYELRLATANYLTYSAMVTVADGQTTRERVTLEPNWGTLQVSSEPAGAAIELNGRATGQVTPQVFTPLEPGVYTVILTREGYGATSEQVTVAKGQRARLSPTLSAKTGLLSVVANYSDGTPCRGALTVDGQAKGQTPTKLDVAAGTHTVKVVCGAGERVEPVNVRHNERTSLEWTIASAPVSGVAVAGKVNASESAPQRAPTRAVPVVDPSTAEPASGQNPLEDQAPSPPSSSSSWSFRLHEILVASAGYVPSGWMAGARVLTGTLERSSAGSTFGVGPYATLFDLTYGTWASSDDQPDNLYLGSSLGLLARFGRSNVRLGGLVGYCLLYESGSTNGLFTGGNLIYQFRIFRWFSVEAGVKILVTFSGYNGTEVLYAATGGLGF